MSELNNLIAALKARDITALNTALTAGAPLNNSDDNGNTALHIAAEKGFGEIIKALIEHGADIEARNKEEQTPLFCAVRYEQPASAAMLMGLGADVLAPHTDGFSVLAMACISNRQPDTLVALLKGGADPNTQFANKGSLVRFAIQLNKANILDMLLKQGAEIEVGIDGDSSVFHAVHSDSGDVIPILAAHGASLEITDTYERTPLVDAIIRNKLNAAKALIEAGANTEHQGNDGTGAIHVAAVNNSAAAVQILAKGGANLDATGSLEQTSLEWAIAKLSFEAIEALAACGANIHVRSKAGGTMLHQAVFSDKEKMIDLFVGFGINPNSTGEKGSTPLHDAATYNKLVTIRALLKHKANPSITRDDGTTPLHLAAYVGDLDAAKILVEAGADIKARESISNCTPAELARKHRNNKLADYIDGKSGLMGFFGKVFK